MDYKASMPCENNVDDIITLSYFKAYLGGLDIISNVESKIKKTGCFEVHDQFLTELGSQLLANAFYHYLEDKLDSISVTDRSSAEDLILNFLLEYKIHYLYDPDNCGDDSHFDDLAKYCSDLCSRTVLSLGK